MTEPASNPKDPGRDALARIDNVLTEKPDKNGTALTEATGLLCQFREQLIAAARSGVEEDVQRLEHINAVLSAVAAIHFPLGPTPWPELEAARGWLADLIREPQASASAPAD